MCHFLVFRRPLSLGDGPSVYLSFVGQPFHGESCIHPSLEKNYLSIQNSNIIPNLLKKVCRTYKTIVSINHNLKSKRVIIQPTVTTQFQNWSVSHVSPSVESPLSVLPFNTPGRNKHMSRETEVHIGKIIIFGEPGTAQSLNNCRTLRRAF